MTRLSTWRNGAPQKRPTARITPWDTILSPAAPTPIANNAAAVSVLAPSAPQSRRRRSNPPALRVRADVRRRASPLGPCAPHRESNRDRTRWDQKAQARRRKILAPLAAGVCPWASRNGERWLPSYPDALATRAQARRAVRPIPGPSAEACGLNAWDRLDSRRLRPHP